MLIVALVLAVIGLAALVTAVVTSNELIAWVCIAASVIGVLLLIVDAVRERSRGRGEDRSKGAEETSAPTEETPAAAGSYEDYPEDDVAAAPEREDEVAAPDEHGVREDEAETTVVEQSESEVSEEDRSR